MTDAIETTKRPVKMSLILPFCFYLLGLLNLVNSGFTKQKPDPANVVDPTFRLFTLKNPKKPDLLDHDNPTSITKSHYQANIPTKVIIHGYRDDPLKDTPQHWMNQIKDELLKKESMNVIILRWTSGASSPNYYQSAANIQTVAAELVKLIFKLKQLFKIKNLSKFHLIGHSLGAQTCGLAGAKLPGLNRITGLDPAGPSFIDNSPEQRLDSTDANFVDVIHSNGKLLIKGGFGFPKPCGHVDFYPDGGTNMPGCKMDMKAYAKLMMTLKFDQIIKAVSCSHSRATKFFIESINSKCKFCSFPCKDYETYKSGNCNKCSGNGCSRMGYYSDRCNKRGTFYLKTKNNSPYCTMEECNC